MITKGIITGVPAPSQSRTTIKYIVDIYIFKDVNDKSNTRINRGVEAIVSYTPGAYVEYSIGDRVLVSFEDNDFGNPVIIGKLLLPKDDLFNYKREIEDLKKQIKQLKATINNLQSICTSLSASIVLINQTKQQTNP